MSETRTCANCGARSSPFIPRMRVGDELWCTPCASNNSFRRTTKANPQTQRMMQLIAAGWTGEDVIRHELGRQKVHNIYVNGDHAGAMCPEHLRMHRSRSDFASGLAAQVGLDHRYPTIQTSPEHEGRCDECSQVQSTQNPALPWEHRRNPGSLPPHEERQPTPHHEGDDEGEGYQRGRWPYRPLSPNRTERHTPVVPAIQSLNMRIAVPVPQEGRPFPGIRVQAHDSGDGETIFHCFSGETEYWTQDGIKTLADTVGTVQTVLANTGNGGVWVEAMIHEFGEQQLTKLTLRRNQKIKVIYATAEHRWLVRTRTDPTRTDSVTRTTEELRPNDRMAWLLPRTSIARSTPSPFGIAHGVAYGDGTRAAKGSVLHLWGEKDAQLLRYFAECRQEPIKTEKGVDGVRVMDLPAFFKDRPSIEESIPYLYGWLAGYFAADGTVGKQGQTVMYSARREDLEFFQLVAMRLGIGAYDIVEKQREGFGEMRALFSLQLIGSTLRPEFFLTKTHRERYEAVASRGNSERMGWTVTSVEKTDRVDTVYCPRVPEHENFVLDGLINTQNCPMCGSGQVIARSDGTVECEFCQTAFTVQIQPQMPAFPQTIDGVPVDVPGMPAGGANANVPSGDPMGDPEEEPPEDAEDESDMPAFLKGSLLLRTVQGDVLDSPQYLRHLALTHANDSNAVLAQIRDENGRG